jgi:predicted dehydrogenase
LAEAEEIIALAKEYNVKGQVGHVERFNPAFIATKNMIEKPMFIKTSSGRVQSQRHGRSSSIGFNDP